MAQVWAEAVICWHRIHTKVRWHHHWDKENESQIDDSGSPWTDYMELEITAAVTWAALDFQLL